MRTCTRARRGAPIEVSEFSPASSRIGASSVGAALVRLPHAAVRRRDRRVDQDLAGEVPRAVHAEMHAQPQVVVELEEHLLADGAHRDRRAAVDDARALREPALRAGCRHLTTDEVAVELAGDPMDGMALGHQPASGSNELSSAARTSGCPTLARGSGSSVPSSSNAAICAIRRDVPLLARERRGDEQVDERRGLVERVLARADRDHVRVVVLAGELGRRDAPHQRRADAAHLVRGDLLAVARTAEHDAERLDAGILIGARPPARRGCRTPGSHRAGRTRAGRGRRRRDPDRRGDAAAAWRTRGRRGRSRCGCAWPSFYGGARWSGSRPGGAIDAI